VEYSARGGLAVNNQPIAAHKSFVAESQFLNKEKPISSKLFLPCYYYLFFVVDGWFEPRVQG
jgi:hypothetical protein